MNAEPIIITVRYANGTYLARVKGCKQTASCVYDAGLAAKSLARKLGLDEENLVKTLDGHDYLEFRTANPTHSHDIRPCRNGTHAVYIGMGDWIRPEIVRVPRELMAELRAFTLENDSGRAGVLRGMIDALAELEAMKATPLRRLPARWKMVPELPTIAMAEAGKRAMAAGGNADAVFAAMLEQAPCPEAWPQQGAQEVQPEAFRKSDALWELESSIKDLARQVEGEYRARYYAAAVGFLRALHMMRVVDAEERNHWKVKILEAHLQAIAQCEAAGEVVPEEIKRREAFELENLRRIERVTEALQGKEDEA